MNEDKYVVLINGEAVANGMDIDMALVLVKGIFNEYFNERNMEVSLKKQMIFCGVDLSEDGEVKEQNE